MSPDSPSQRPGLWIGLLLGLPVIAWGIRGALIEGARTHPAELARWIVGAALVHDLVLLPAVLAVAVGVRRITPERAWPFVRWALATSGCVALVAWPFIRGYGRRSSNPSLLPRDYAGGVAIALLLVWVVAASLAWASARRSRVRARPAASVDDGLEHGGPQLAP
ncbi:MAG: hypothetical protein ACOYXM_03050 [Actinomycetota bacterium]